MNLNEVYIVTAGSYSDYRIIAVFSDKDRATEFSKYIEGSSVETHELFSDKMPKTAYPLDYKRYKVRMNRNGDVDWVSSSGFMDCGDSEVNWWHEDARHNTVNFYIISNSEERAIKIAGEMRREIIANNHWPEVKNAE